ncbi:MAG: DUF4197 domain-containing protein [Bacteroidota bacterium]
MMIRILPLLLSFCLMGCPASLGDLIEAPLSNADIASGLKEALNLGTDEAVDFLAVKDGFYKSVYKIYLPEEAREVTDKLKVIPGFSNVEEIILERINRAAEDAAKSVGPIFLNSIRDMTINDALGILMGEKDAATGYLHRTTNDQLYGQFQPIILESLNKFNAVDYWADAVNTYNKIPLIGGNVNPRLDDYVTQEALKGLFSLIEKKEEGIRTDINQRVTPLLQKVFQKQDPT